MRMNSLLRVSTVEAKEKKRKKKPDVSGKFSVWCDWQFHKTLHTQQAVDTKLCNVQISEFSWYPDHAALPTVDCVNHKWLLENVYFFISPPITFVRRCLHPQRFFFLLSLRISSSIWCHSLLSTVTSVTCDTVLAAISTFFLPELIFPSFFTPITWFLRDQLTVPFYNHQQRSTTCSQATHSSFIHLISLSKLSSSDLVLLLF